MRELFDIIKIIFENPKEYKNISNIEKRKISFIFNRRVAIKYPLQSNILQIKKINEIAVIDYWQRFLNKQHNKVPYWMYTKGVKKSVEKKEKELNIKENTIKEFANYYSYDIKSVRESLKIFPNEMKKELVEFEKLFLS